VGPIVSVLAVGLWVSLRKRMARRVAATTATPATTEAGIA